MPSAMMMMSGRPASTFGGPADIPTLVTGLGGDTVVRGMYDARTKVTVGPNGAVIVEDARQSGGGRYAFPAGGGIDCGRCTAFDGVTKATWIIWGSCYDSSVGSFCAVSNLDGNSPFLFDHFGSTIRLLCSSGTATWDRPSAAPIGALFKYMIVYDGTQSGGSRCTGYYSVYDRSTATWSARATLNKTGDGVGSSMATTTSHLLKIGGYGSSAGTFNNIFHGFIDELRMWTGTALTTTQLDAEDLSSAPATPNLRYAFATDASNTGSTSGNNGSASGDATLVGGDLAYGPPLITNNLHPSWNGTDAITFSASGGLYAGSPNFTAVASGPVECGYAIVSTEPTNGGTPTMADLIGGARSGSDELITLYKSGSTMNVFSGSNGPSISSASLIRCLHARRAGTSSSRVAGLQDGTGSEQTSTATFSATVPDFFSVGINGGFGNASTMVWRAAILIDGNPSSGQRSTINTWAAANHGATV